MNFARWGINLAEMRNERWPRAEQDRSVPEETWYRAVCVNAPRNTVFRWVCQLRTAPYSYDWIDNFGRQSPRHLIAAVEPLQIGQKVMRIFRVGDFSIDRFITIVLWPPRSVLCSKLRITYVCAAVGRNQTRLMVRVQIWYPKHPFRPIVCALVPPGDLFMMRKQLLTLKQLAEQSHRD
jgi:hypothetical protein